MRRRLLALTIAVLAAAPLAHAAPPDFAAAEPGERRIINDLLEDAHWPFRVFALIRLERYDGTEIGSLIRARLEDEAWQVRAFAIRALARRGLTIEDGQLDEESDGRVIRAAIRCGIPIDESKLTRGTKRLMRTRAIDELLLGLEIAQASSDRRLRNEAERRLRVLITNMDVVTIARIGDRLPQLLGMPPGTAPDDARAWFEWRKSNDIALGPAPEPIAQRDPDNPTLIASLDPDAFARLIDYLGVLRASDLQMAVVMDATSSMIPMVTEARVGVERLILFMNDLSRTMELAIVAYRDRDHASVWDGQPFTTDIKAMRDFLFRIAITGGADLPEAVLDGLVACRQLEWNRESMRRIILVGDARPHETDLFEIANVVDECRDAGVVVNAIHVPMVPSEAYLASLGADRRAAYIEEINAHNVHTAEDFARIAQDGGGHKVELTAPWELVPSLMRMMIERDWWPAFDEFYDLYSTWCR